MTLANELMPEGRKTSTADDSITSKQRGPVGAGADVGGVSELLLAEHYSEALDSLGI